MTAVVISIVVAFAVLGVRAVALPGVTAFVLAWVWLYTFGLPADIRHRRLAEMRSHLSEQTQEGREAGYSPDLIAIQMTLQFLRGMLADLSWRVTSGETCSTAPGAVILPDARSLVPRYPTFEEFHEANYPLLFAHVYAMVSDTTTTEDIVSECFARIFTEGHDLVTAAQGMLYVVARQEVREALRSGRLNDLERGQHETPGKGRDDFALATKLGLIAMALIRLPYDARELLSLRFNGELTYGQIAQLLGSSEAVIKTRLFRALTILKRELGEERSQARSDEDDDNGGSLVPTR